MFLCLILPFARSDWQEGREDETALNKIKQQNINNLEALPAQYRIKIYSHLQSPAADTLMCYAGVKKRFILCIAGWKNNVFLTFSFFFSVCTLSLLFAAIF